MKLTTINERACAHRQEKQQHFDDIDDHRRKMKASALVVALIW